MATGIQGYIGIGKETDWGTAVASSTFVSATESISEERERLREPMTFGTRSTLPAVEGRTRITGGITGLHARPDLLGVFLRAALGAPVTTGSGPYEHVFEPKTAKHSALAALPPYSVTVQRGSLRHRYGGGQLNTLTLRQPSDEALAIDTDWIFKNVADVGSAEVIALETNRRFIFRDLAVTKGGSPFTFLEDLTLTFENQLEAEETLNGSREISSVDFNEKLQVTASMTLTFRDATTYADFKAATTSAWEFKWTSPDGPVLTIAIPKLQLDTWGAPISGPGRMTVDVTATAEYDSSDGHEVEVTLENSTATY